MSSFLNEIKIATLAAQKKQRDDKTLAAINKIKDLIKVTANSGLSFLEINSNAVDSNLSTNQIENINKYFINEKFECSIINNYSLFISWEL